MNKDLLKINFTKTETDLDDVLGDITFEFYSDYYLIVLKNNFANSDYLSNCVIGSFIFCFTDSDDENNNDYNDFVLGNLDFEEMVNNGDFVTIDDVLKANKNNRVAFLPDGNTDNEIALNRIEKFYKIDDLLKVK